MKQQAVNRIFKKAKASIYVRQMIGGAVERRLTANRRRVHPLSAIH